MQEEDGFFIMVERRLLEDMGGVSVDFHNGFLGPNFRVHPVGISGGCC